MQLIFSREKIGKENAHIQELVNIRPSNCNISLKRLKGQLGRLRKEPEILEEYESVIK